MLAVALVNGQIEIVKIIQENVQPSDSDKRYHLVEYTKSRKIIEEGAVRQIISIREKTLIEEWQLLNKLPEDIDIADTPPTQLEEFPEPALEMICTNCWSSVPVLVSELLTLDSSSYKCHCQFEEE